MNRPAGLERSVCGRSVRAVGAAGDGRDRNGRDDNGAGRRDGDRRRVGVHLFGRHGRRRPARSGHGRGSGRGGGAAVASRSAAIALMLAATHLRANLVEEVRPGRAALIAGRCAGRGRGRRRSAARRLSAAVRLVARHLRLDPIEQSGLLRARVAAIRRAAGSTAGDRGGGRRGDRGHGHIGPGHQRRGHQQKSSIHEESSFRGSGCGARGRSRPRTAPARAKVPPNRSGKRAGAKVAHLASTHPGRFMMRLQQIF